MTLQSEGVRATDDNLIFYLSGLKTFHGPALASAGAVVKQPTMGCLDENQVFQYVGGLLSAADAQIVAVCREHGVDRLLTSDRDFARFKDISVELLD